MFPDRVAREVVERLTHAGCVAADEEARELLTAAADLRTLREWVTRRERGEPLAWITGRVRFCGRVVRVDPGVYVPRPQTERLARLAAQLLPSRGWAVDLCTGSGAVAVHLAHAVAAATVVGTDVDPRAARCARANRVSVVVTDLGGGLRSRVFDVVTAVPPYVPTSMLRLLAADVLHYEPRGALAGGVDGLDLVRRLVGDAARLLRPGGWLLMEIGGAQDAAVRPLLEAVGFGSVRFWRDGAGDLRGVVARRTEIPE